MSTLTGGQQQEENDQQLESVAKAGSAGQEESKQQSSQSGYMAGFLSKGAAGLTQMTSSPEIFLELSTPPNQRSYYQNMDEVSGTLSLEVPFEIQHDGIKVVLRGNIVNKANDTYFGNSKLGGMMPKGQSYEFLQLNRNVDGPGTLDKGTFDYQFNFKNVDLDTDSYFGIILDVEWTVEAEMIYKGSMMSYTVKDKQKFYVRNNKPQKTFSIVEEPKTEESKETSEAAATQQIELQAAPTYKIEYQGFRDSAKPCTIELYVHNTNLCIDRDIISGYVKMKELSTEHQNKISSIQLQLVQQEIQGQSKSLPPPMTGQAAIEQAQGGSQKYLLRVIKDYQIVDGCQEEGDIVDFRLPLRAASSQYITPTVKNVCNKFSMRYFLRIVLKTASLYRVEVEKAKAKKENDSEEDKESFENLEEQEEELDVESNFIEVQLWR